MKISDLKRSLSVFICLSGAVLFLLMGCNAKKTEKHESNGLEVAENVETIISLDILEEDFSPENIIEFKASIVNRMLPAVSDKNKEELNRLIKYLDGVDKNFSTYFNDNNNLIDFFQALVRLVVIAAEIGPDDFDINLKVATQHVAAGNMIGYFAQSEDHKQLSSEYKKKGVQALKDLVKKFPDEAKAYDQLATALWIVEGEKQRALELYKRCLELDPESENCRKNYDRIR